MAFHFLVALAYTVGVLYPFACLLHLFPRLGTAGKAIAAWCCRAPGLDLVVFILTALPWIVGPAVWGWPGFVGGVLGQYVVLILWTLTHEAWHFDKRHTPRMYRVHNRLLGTWRNLSSLLVTSLCVPVFIVVRLGEYVTYWYLVRVTRLPAYKDREWVNVTRQKYGGLVGHDRIWCLYCDWMTGVWSLGSEMLRNVESFWCPIRFQDGVKCANCTVDFPDIDNGWAPADGDIVDAVATLERQYERDPRPPSNAYFGHPVRLTVKGEPTDHA